MSLKMVLLWVLTKTFYKNSRKKTTNTPIVFNKNMFISNHCHHFSKKTTKKTHRTPTARALYKPLLKRRRIDPIESAEARHPPDPGLPNLGASAAGGFGGGDRWVCACFWLFFGGFGGFVVVVFWIFSWGHCS